MTRGLVRWHQSVERANRPFRHQARASIRRCWPSSLKVYRSDKEGPLRGAGYRSAFSGLR